MEDEKLRDHFHNLAQQFSEETSHSSSFESDHPAYQELSRIGKDWIELVGPRIGPLVIQSLVEERHDPWLMIALLGDLYHWGPALEHNEKGKLHVIRDKWILWARKNGFFGPSYSVVTSDIENQPGTWNYQEVRIKLIINEFGKQKGEFVGSYIRNYHALYNTFHHFRKNGKDYALYSKRYTATRLMELPSCKDLGGEEPDGMGFCPVDYYVPWYDKEEPKQTIEANHGFIAGCVWGDDMSWKIQYLDLSDVQNGHVKREEKFGYIHLPRGLSLEDAIDTTMLEDGGESIGIANTSWFDFVKNEFMTW